MPVKEAVLAALQELVLPELAVIKQEQVEVKTAIALTAKRLDDMNAHLVDQSRRIDAVREVLTGRLDALREELGARIDDTHKRLDNLFAVIVRREEHQDLSSRVRNLGAGNGGPEKASGGLISGQKLCRDILSRRHT